MEQHFLFSMAGVLIGLCLAAAASWIRKRQQKIEVQFAQNTAARIIDEAKKDANAIKKEAEIHARDSVQQERVEFDKEVRETKRELQSQEKRLFAKEEALEKRVESLEKRERRHWRKNRLNVIVRWTPRNANGSKLLD